MKRRRFVALLAAAVAVPRAGAQAPATREVHGALDAYAAEGVALAWAILRGRDEQTTRVIVRVEADPARFGSLSVTGVDPFTRASVALMPLRPLAGRYQFFAPRARFADHPRSEWRFYRDMAPPSDAVPVLLVYFQGVPDTAPEFDDAGKLDAYLAQRLERARREAKGPVK